MSDLFLKIINMSISASWLVLAVLLFRIVLQRAPKWINVLLWGIVAIRLICPFSIESALSLIPSAETIPANIGMDTTPAINSGISSINRAINPLIGQSNIPVAGASVNPLQITIAIYANIWVLGVLGMLLYTAISYFRLRRKVSEATILRNSIYQSENVPSPFVLGILKPKIYLPYGMDDQNLSHVVAHEQAHIRRRDHWWKPLGFFLLTIHWFNPLMWVAYVLLCRDIELACDEKVIKELGDEQRADYTQALVVCSVNRRMISACPLAFGEVGVKERVKSVMNYKKPAFWIIVLSVVACAVVAICFLTDPITSVRNPWVQEYVPGAEDIIGNVDKEKYESISEDFAIGADQYGRAVFKDPHKAFDTFIVLFADGIALIQEQNDLAPISKKNYSSYKAMGWQVTSGPKEAQQQAIFVTKFLDIYENSFTKDIPAPNTEIPTTEPSPSVTKWFDYLEAPEEMPRDGRLEINIPTFPDVTFRWYPEKIEAVTGEEIVPLYTGMPIWNAYFCDLTGDNLPELCSTYSFGSGMIDSRVIIYDYANGASYELANRGIHDFTLWLNDSDGQLYVDKRSYFGGGLIFSGQLVFKDGCIQILGQGTVNTSIIDIVDPTKDENFSYDTAVEKFFEDKNNEYFFSGLYSQYVIVHYADDTTEDIVTALSNGRATLADLDSFGIRYWAEPKPQDLSSAIISTILDHYRPSDPDGLYHCASFVLLEQDELCFDSDPPMPNHVIVYGMALHEKFSFAEETIREVEGRYVPVKLTFERTENGGMSLINAWFPEQPYDSWDEYSESVYEQFSTHSEDLANSILYAILDDIYLVQLKQDCYRQAVAYIGIDTTPIIEQLFAVIESSPLHSSNPGSYIDAHRAEYNELIYYGNYTLHYIFSRFLEGNQIGLRGHIMRALLDDLAPESQLRLYAMTGQEYFDAWKDAAIRVSEQHNMDWMKENQGAVWLLLQMIDE